MFFILVHVTFFSSRCMLELKFAIYYRAASLPSQASYAVLAEESQAFFKRSLHTNSISNSAILSNNYISLLSDLCACVWVHQWAVRIVTSNQEKSDGLVHCSVKMLLFCVKTIVKVTQIWTSPSEEEGVSILPTAHRTSISHPKYIRDSCHTHSFISTWSGCLGNASLLYIIESLKRCDMSRYDLVSAWNHVEDMVDVSPLTTNVCITHHETFSLKY